jgi:hypothetical protein
MLRELRALKHLNLNCLPLVTDVGLLALLEEDPPLSPSPLTHLSVRGTKVTTALLDSLLDQPASAPHLKELDVMWCHNLCDVVDLIELYIPRLSRMGIEVVTDADEVYDY